MIAPASHSCPSRRSRRTSGITLIEVALSILLISLVAGATLVLAGFAGTSASANTAVIQVEEISQSIRTLFAGKADYSALTAAILSAQGGLPASIAQGGALSSAFKSPIQVGPGTIAGSYAITLQNVPIEGCAKMAGYNFGGSLLAVQVGATTYPVPPLPTPAQVAANCSVPPPLSLTWTFY